MLGMTLRLYDCTTLLPGNQLINSLADAWYALHSLVCGCGSIFTEMFHCLPTYLR